MDPSAAARASPRAYYEAAQPRSAGYQLPQQRGYPDGRAAAAAALPPLSTGMAATAQGDSPTGDRLSLSIGRPLSSHAVGQSPFFASQPDLAFRDPSRYPQPEPASYPVGVSSPERVSPGGYEAAPPTSRSRSQSGATMPPRLPSRPPSAYGHRRTPSRSNHMRGPSEDYAVPALPGSIPLAYYPQPQPAYSPAVADPRATVTVDQARALIEALRANQAEMPAPPPSVWRAPEPPSQQIEIAALVDAIRSSPQRMSAVPSHVPGQQLGQLDSRPSVAERRAGPSLNIASARPEQGISVMALNSASLGSRMEWYQVPPTTDSSLDAKWEKASHIERQGPPMHGGGGGGGGGPPGWSGSQGGDFSSKEVKDKNLVDWDGPDDPENPANWPMRKKYRTSLILSLFSFIAPFSATMVGPAMDVIGAELDIAPGTPQRLIQGLNVLAAGVGPFIVAPLIEAYGRVPVIRYAHLWHLIWNTACGFATTGPQLLAFRFIGGLGSSAPQVLAPGLTADIYPAPMGGRGDAVHAYLPFFGSALAPIFGAFVTQDSDWRWIFWGTSIFSTVAVGLAFTCLDESNHRVLLERRAKRLREETGNKNLHTPFHTPGQTESEWMIKKICLPFIMLVCHPVVQVPFSYRAYLFGIMYLILSNFEKSFVEIYRMDKASASLNYLAIGVGFVLGLHISRYAIDGFSAYFRKKHQTNGHMPEWRLPVNSGAAILIPPALILYGWSLQNQYHYVVPDLAAFLLAIGLILGFFSLQPYVTESYGLEYAASAHAVGAFLQHISEFAFPLFGPPIYDDLGLGWGNTLLAILTLAICILMPLLLWHFGPGLRAVSTRGLPVGPSGRR
ncbi:hypothetical protein RB595_008931 [Gaeumannomyces hyphopodioides]